MQGIERGHAFQDAACDQDRRDVVRLVIGGERRMPELVDPLQQAVLVHRQLEVDLGASRQCIRVKLRLQRRPDIGKRLDCGVVAAGKSPLRHVHHLAGLPWCHRAIAHGAQGSGEVRHSGSCQDA